MALYFPTMLPTLVATNVDAGSTKGLGMYAVVMLILMVSLAASETNAFSTSSSGGGFDPQIRRAAVAAT
jgi:hypothetical protein